MKKLWLILLLACTAFNAYSFQGERAAPLHVDGRYLKDAAGHVVNMHGVHATIGAWFEGEAAYYVNGEYQKCLAHFIAMVDRLSDTASGFYLNQLRLGVDDSWVLGNMNAPYSDISNYQLFDLDNFKKAVDSIVVPLARHMRERGMYLVILPPFGTQDINADYIANKMVIWDYLSSHPEIKNAPNIQFELANEPVNIQAEDGTVGNGDAKYTKALVQAFQPIYNKIRDNGANNIVWMPGLGYQSIYANFPTYPLQGFNIGYAVHWYPAYFGMGDDPTAIANAWNANIKPTADFAPINITEMLWFRFQPGDNDYNHLFDGITGNTGFGFGANTHQLIDNSGNVSWLIHQTANFLTNSDPNGTVAYGGDIERGGGAAIQWYKAYANSVWKWFDRNAAQGIIASDYDSLSGSIRAEVLSAGATDLGWIKDGDYAGWNGIDFTMGVDSVTLAIASDPSAGEGSVEIHLDNAQGTLLANIDIPKTAGWADFANVGAKIPAVTGWHNLAMIFHAKAGTAQGAFLGNLSAVTFMNAPVVVPVSSSSVTTSSSSSIPPSSSSQATTHVLASGNGVGIFMEIQGNQLKLHFDQSGQGSMKIVDLMGHTRQMFAPGFFNAGDHVFSLNQLPNGVYIVQLTTNHGGITHKLTLIQ